MNPAALWWAVVVSGLYHGLNPGMGWPLAVSAALMERRQMSLFAALGAMTGGHFIATLAILLPFTFLFVLVAWQREIQAVAALLVIGLGVYLLTTRRHPRFLARVPPSRLTLWSALAATAHGAGLMLVPIYLGIGAAVDTETGHSAVSTLIRGNLTVAVAVAVIHTLAMAAAGGALAVGVYHWLGLRFIRQGWFNLDLVWAGSLVLVGGIALWHALAGP